MARSFFYFYFSFLFSFNLFAGSQIFLNYCEKVINNDQSFSKDFFYTTKVLIETVATKDCETAFKRLSSFK